MKILAKQRIESVERVESMATVGRDYAAGICIQVNPDVHRINDINGFYFKVYNSVNWPSADKIARIKFSSAKYVDHTNLDGKQNWIMNNKEIKALMDWFKKRATNSGHNITNWQYCIALHNNERGLDIDQSLNNTKANWIYPDYIPIDLPMPNYLELE